MFFKIPSAAIKVKEQLVIRNVFLKTLEGIPRDNPEEKVNSFQE